MCVPSRTCVFTYMHAHQHQNRQHALWDPLGLCPKNTDPSRKGLEWLPFKQLEMPTSVRAGPCSSICLGSQDSKTLGAGSISLKPLHLGHISVAESY